MIYLAGIGTFATAFVALYCSSVCDAKWFKLLVTGVVSATITILVIGNMWRVY